MTQNNHKTENPYDVQARALFEQYQRQYSELCVMALRTGFSVPQNPLDDQLEKAREEVKVKLFSEIIRHTESTVDLNKIAKETITYIVNSK